MRDVYAPRFENRQGCGREKEGLGAGVLAMLAHCGEAKRPARVDCACTPITQSLTKATTQKAGAVGLEVER